MKLASLTAILMAVAPAAHAAAAQAEQITAPASVGFSVLRVIGALCLVFSLLFTGLWIYRNSARFSPGRGRAAKLKVLESRTLGHRHSIFVVAYEQQRILLSTSPTGVSMLTHLPDGSSEQETLSAPGPAPAPLANFSALFFQAVNMARK